MTLPSVTSYGNKRGSGRGLHSQLHFKFDLGGFYFLIGYHQELCLWKDYSIRPGRKIKHSDVRLQTIKKGCEFNVYTCYYLELKVLRGEYILHVLTVLHINMILHQYRAMFMPVMTS